MEIQKRTKFFMCFRVTFTVFIVSFNHQNGRGQSFHGYWRLQNIKKKKSKPCHMKLQVFQIRKFVEAVIPTRK